MVRKARGGDDVGTLTLLDLQLRVGVSPWSLYGLPPHSLGGFLRVRVGPCSIFLDFPVMSSLPSTWP